MNSEHFLLLIDCPLHTRTILKVGCKEQTKGAAHCRESDIIGLSVDLRLDAHQSEKLIKQPYEFNQQRKGRCFPTNGLNSASPKQHYS